MVCEEGERNVRRPARGRISASEYERAQPDPLANAASWVNDTLDRCYQLMETEDPALLDQRMANWTDLVDFEVHPVFTSKEASEKISSLL